MRDSHSKKTTHHLPHGSKPIGCDVVASLTGPEVTELEIHVWYQHVLAAIVYWCMLLWKMFDDLKPAVKQCDLSYWFFQLQLQLQLMKLFSDNYS